MFAKAIQTVDPRLLSGISGSIVLALTIALLPVRGWLVAAAVLILGAAVTGARARRCNALDLPPLRYTAE